MDERLTAGEVCTRVVAIAFPSMGLTDAARLMREQHVGCLVVVEEVDAGRVVVGVLTDRDIVTAVVAKAMDPGTLRVGDVMTTDLVTAAEEDSMMDVLATMRRKGVRRVPVVGRQGVLAGVIAMDDLIEVITRQLQVLVQAMRSEQRHEQARRP